MIAQLHNIQLSNDEYRNVANVIRPVIRKLKNKLNLKVDTLNSLIQKNNLQAKHFRGFFIEKNYKLKNCQPSKTRYFWASTPFNTKREERFIGLWNVNFAPMNLRNFFFKFLNNKLLLNANLANATNNENIAGCTMCHLGKVLPQCKENYSHLFMNCHTTSYLFERYFNEFFAHTDLTWDKQYVFTGVVENLTNNYASIANLEILLCLHFLWTEKLKKKYPLLNNMKAHVNYYRELFLSSSKYKKAYDRWMDYNPIFNNN